MSKYIVTGGAYASVFNRIEAESPEAAAGQLHASLCHQCTSEVELGDIDGCEVRLAEGSEEVLFSLPSYEDDKEKSAAAALAAEVALCDRLAEVLSEHCEDAGCDGGGECAAVLAAHRERRA